VGSALWLALLGFNIALIIGFVVFVECTARNRPETPIGRNCVKIDPSIDRLRADQMHVLQHRESGLEQWASR
jgi:hypothetical protein